jgi:DNA-binding NarL/FixJ family response regulator
MITILLVDDHKIVRKGLKALLEKEDDMAVLGETGDGQEAQELARLVRPDIIVMDISLPKINGIEVSKKILATSLPTKILILSAYSDSGYIEKSHSMGISGFLLKHCGPHLLIEAIRSVVKGQKFFSPLVGERKEYDRCIVDENYWSFGSKRSPKLSLRESEILQLVAKGNSNKVSAFEMGISIKTVEKHRQNLMNKLSIHDTAGLTRFAVAQGFITCIGVPVK